MPSNYVNTYGVVTLTAATETITADGYAGNRIVMNRAAGITATLPAATGTGIEYVFVLAVDASGSQIIRVANSTDTMMGTANLSVAAVPSTYQTVDATSDTITMNGTTTGGLRGARVSCIDIASGLWAVSMSSEATGTAATPFSATV